MTDKQLQRVTEYVADIGHAPMRRALSVCCNHVVQKYVSPTAARSSRTVQ